MFDEKVLQCFLENQSQLYPDPVAETPEEAEAFLEESMAVVVDSVREVWEFFEEEGIDVEDADEESILEADESVRDRRRKISDCRGIIMNCLYERSFRIMSARPSLSLSRSVTMSAACFTLSVAFSMAIPVPAASSMEISFSASPAA